MKTTYTGSRRKPIPYFETPRRYLKAKFKDYAEILTRMGYHATYENPKPGRASITITKGYDCVMLFSRKEVWWFLMFAK